MGRWSTDDTQNEEQNLNNNSSENGKKTSSIKLRVPVKLVYPLLLLLCLSFSIITWFYNEPSIWSPGLKNYQSAYCPETLAIKFKNRHQKSERQRAEIEIEASMCQNNKYIEMFDKHYNELCKPKYISQTISAVVSLSLIGIFGTFVFLIHKGQTVKTLQGTLLKLLMAWHVLCLTASAIGTIRSIILYMREEPAINRISTPNFCYPGTLFTINLICCALGFGSSAFNLWIIYDIYKQQLKKWQKKKAIPPAGSSA